MSNKPFTDTQKKDESDNSRVESFWEKIGKQVQVPASEKDTETKSPSAPKDKTVTGKVIGKFSATVRGVAPDSDDEDSDKE